MENKIKQINQLTDKELIRQLYFTQILLLVTSVVLSKFLFNGGSFWQQMIWSDYRIVTIGLTAGSIVVFLDFLLMHWLPPAYYDDGGINERIFRNQRLYQIFFIALLVAFSEEMLFRGIFQTKLGLMLASLIFAVIHFRYLFHWFLFLNVVLLSLFIGFVYEWTNNLAVTIVMHFVIDFLIGLQIKCKYSKKDNEQE